MAPARELNSCAKPIRRIFEGQHPLHLPTGLSDEHFGGRQRTEQLAAQIGTARFGERSREGLQLRLLNRKEHADPSATVAARSAHPHPRTRLLSQPGTL